MEERKEYLNLIIICNIIIIAVCIVSLIRVGYSPYPIIIVSLNIYSLLITLQEKFKK